MKRELLSLRRLRGWSNFFSGEETRFAASCGRALRGLEGGGGVPLELLPMGTRMVAQGALTTRLLSTGRTRPWPIGFTKQLDPEEPGFLPRALLPIHVNLFYRDWTTVGLPGWEKEAVVDPGGWVTPERDGPSVAVWVGDSRKLYTLGPLPGWGKDSDYELSQERIDDYPMVKTTGRRGDTQVEIEVFPAVVNGQWVVGITTRVRNLAPASRPIRVGFALRPANPEGASPVFDLAREDSGLWQVNGSPFLYLPRSGDEIHLRTGDQGDVYSLAGGVLREGTLSRGETNPVREVQCDAGQATGCEIYRINLSPGETFKRTAYAVTEASVAEVLRRSSATRLVSGMKADFRGLVRAGSSIELPVHGDLFKTTRTTLLALCDTDTITPGPATYHHFFFRDAAYLLAALNRLGFGRRVATILSAYAGRQARDGSWISQGGEWDGTGQAIWSIMDHVRHTGNQKLLKRLYPSIAKGAQWIERTQEKGLMPPGWSAEHLGPADQYYWDSIWSCAGLREAAAAADQLGKRRDAEQFMRSHGAMLEFLRNSFGKGPVPAAPGRDLNSAAVSILSASWPLGLLAAREPCLVSTIQWLHDNSLRGGALFHDVVHSGINPYLTCHLAQAKLMAGMEGACEHLDALARGASPTGCWPEAYLPGRGGVMGDGDHGWAAAEFAMLQRNLLVWEEGGVLHLFRGTDRRWWEGHTLVEDLPTVFGNLDLELLDGHLRVEGRWREAPNRVVWHKPEGEKGTLVVNSRSKSSKKSRVEL